MPVRGDPTARSSRALRLAALAATFKSVQATGKVQGSGCTISVKDVDNEKLTQVTGSSTSCPDGQQNGDAAFCYDFFSILRCHKVSIGILKLCPTQCPTMLAQVPITKFKEL